MLARLKPVARDLVADVLYAAGVTRPGRAARDKLTVATFHRVLPAAQRDEYPLPGIAVTPAELGFCLDFFREHFSCGSLCEMAEPFVQGRKFDRPPLAITFDDGQLDNFVHARPELERRGLRASFFVPVEAVETGAALWHDRIAYAVRAWFRRSPTAAAAALRLPSTDVDAEQAVRSTLQRAKRMPTEPRAAWVTEIERGCGSSAVAAWDGMMNWEQVRELAAAGHEIGSHSMTHPMLPLCTDEELSQEIEASRAVLAERLGQSPVTFCYPNGDHDTRSVDAVRRAGYRWAVTTRWGLNTQAASAFELRRCDIDAERARARTGNLDPAQLAWRLSGLHPGLR